MRAGNLAFRFFWELPQNLLGLAVWLCVRKRVVRRQTFGPCRMYYLKAPYFGLSVGGFIFVPEWADKSFVGHEYGHTRQSLYLGPLYLIAVGLPSILRAIYARLHRRDAGWYHRGYPERWADRLGGV